MFCSRSLNNRINCLHERVLRIVYQNYSDSFESILSRDGSFKIHHRNIQRVAIEMYKVKNDLSPNILMDLFSKNSHPTRSDFVRPGVNTTKYGKNSFAYFGTLVWDDLVPESFKNVNSLHKFKSMAKCWFPINFPLQTL